MLVYSLGWALVFRSEVGVVLTLLTIRSSREYAPKKRCCEPSLMASTTFIAHARRD
jgi:hypothetical protein